jgi:uncharacterized membrane protein
MRFLWMTAIMSFGNLAANAGAELVLRRHTIRHAADQSAEAVPVAIMLAPQFFFGFLHWTYCCD